MFLASSAYQQGMHSGIKHSLDLIIISIIWKCRNFINSCFIETDNCTVIGAPCRLGCSHPNLQAALIIVHTSVSVYHFFFLLALQPPMGVVFYITLAGFSLLAYEVS